MPQDSDQARDDATSALVLELSIFIYRPYLTGTGHLLSMISYQQKKMCRPCFDIGIFSIGELKILLSFEDYCTKKGYSCIYLLECSYETRRP